jgi:hypothetical protein
LANRKLVDFLEKAVLNFAFQIQQKALCQLSWLSTFKDVFIYDASPIRLPASLSTKFPGNRSNHSPACLKLSALYKMSVRAIEWMKLTDQKTHDSQILPDIEQLKGSLFLFDLGYFSHLFLHQLNQIGVWFVCRLKANSVPIITRVVKGVAKRYIGCPLNDKVKLRGSIVEVWAKLILPGKGFIEVRLIGFRFPKTKQYRWYATNLKSAMLLAEWIYPIYRLRWQIETFYRDFKHTMKATCWHRRTPTTFHQELLVHMIVVCLIRIAMLEASQLAKVCVGHLSFARALTETRLFFQLILSSGQSNSWTFMWAAFVKYCAKYRVKIKPNRQFPRDRQQYRRKSRGLERKRPGRKPKATKAVPSMLSRPETLKNRRDGVYLLS